MSFSLPSGNHNVAIEPPSFIIPSGKRLHNYGKSPCLRGKLTISMAIFNSFLYVLPEGIIFIDDFPS